MNVLGLMGKEGSFKSWVFDGTISSAIVVAFFDELADSLTRPMAAVIDNASIHTSHEFTQNLEEWRKKGLIIVNIPPYSPELNLIEILWRKIKYEWMPFSAYQSFQTLKDSLFEILANIGSSYTINFT
nr:transposase [Methylocucumis oryzae]